MYSPPQQRSLQSGSKQLVMSLPERHLWTIVRWSDIMRYRPLGKMALFHKASSGKRFICCKLTVQYIICSMVGWSIAYVWPGVHIYLETLRLSKYGALVIHISYGPHYHTIYITYVLYNYIYIYIHIFLNLFTPCCHGNWHVNGGVYFAYMRDLAISSGIYFRMWINLSPFAL